MSKSKLNTLWWVVSLSVMGLLAAVWTVSDILGILLSDAVVNAGGLLGLFSLFGFGYGMIKKVEERNEDVYIN